MKPCIGIKNPIKESGFKTKVPTIRVKRLMTLPNLLFLIRSRIQGGIISKKMTSIRDVRRAKSSQYVKYEEKKTPGIIETDTMCAGT